MLPKILSKNFFNRPSLQVAKKLLGKFLVRKIGNKRIAVMITEVEAYDGPRDLASHASRGLTPRNAPMFGEAGHFYVYFTYGMHWMLNIVTGPRGYPAAVLIRGAITENGEHINGPARLTKYLKIDKGLSGLYALKRTGLWLEDRRVRVKQSDIIASPRIGVDYAGKWAKRKYNFRVH